MDALWHGVAVGRPYALLLLERPRMPDTDGLTLAAKIRDRADSRQPHYPAHVRDRPGDPARFRELRVDGHLLKPVQQDELLEAIYSIVNRSGGDGCAPVRRAAPPPPPPPHPTQEAVPAATPLRVLVAEDSEFNAQLMEKLLAKRGHGVRLVGTAGTLWRWRTPPT